MRSWEYNRFGVLMGASSLASCPRWPSLRGYSWPMITLFSLQGDFCATACKDLLSQKFQKSGLRILSQPNGKGNRSIQRVNSTPKQPLSQWTGCCLRQLFRPQENDLEFLALSHWAR